MRIYARREASDSRCGNFGRGLGGLWEFDFHLFLKKKQFSSDIGDLLELLLSVHVIFHFKSNSKRLLNPTPNTNFREKKEKKGLQQGT